jgi:hypothetical protein
MAPLAALMAVFVIAASPDGSLPLRVVSDVAECPSPPEVRSALRQALGDGDSSASGWTLWYGRDLAAPAAERGASLLMELVDPAGERLTTRRIPTPAGDCGAIATAMAAVVERSLRDLGWTRGESLPESAGPAKTVEKPAQAVAPAPEKKNPVPRLVLGAGPLFASTSRIGINVLLEARVRVAGPLCLRLGAAGLSGSDSESLTDGKVSLTSRTFSLAALAALFVGRVELAGGPVVLLAVDQARSDLKPAGSGTRAVVAVGVGIGAALPLSRRWRIALELDGARVAFAPETYVNLNGIKTTVLTPSPWQGIASAKLEFVPWP